MPIISRPPSSDGRVAQHRSRSAWRTISPPAISCANPPQAAWETPSRFGPRRRDSGTRLRPRRDVPAKPSRAPRQPPTNRIPCPGASAPMADSMPHASAPPIRDPPRRSLDAQGRTPAGGPQGPRHFFGFFAPCAAREQREKLPSGYFYFHARLRFLPCRRARAACDSRDARHATGAGLKSQRSKT